MWLILSGGFSFGKMSKNMEAMVGLGNATWAAMARLGSIGLKETRKIKVSLLVSSPL